MTTIQLIQVAAAVLLLGTSALVLYAVIVSDLGPRETPSAPPARASKGSDERRLPHAA